MSSLPLVKVQAATAGDVCAHFYLPVEILERTRRPISPREFLDSLIKSKHYLVGIDFMAHALPPREAIWWGCLCLQHACSEKLSPPEKAACKSAMEWVMQPTEENRVFAQKESEQLGIALPAGALAGAAGQTGGNTAPPNFPPTPPPPYAPAKLVAMAVKIAATKGDPAKMPLNHQLFVELGIAVAEGRYL